MKDKLEVGIYVRTKWGYICKIININDFREPSMKYGVEASYLKDIMFIGDDDISKASHNIIDIVQVGDYVNGCYIQEIKSLKDNVMVCMLDSDYEFVSTITNKEIKSIVTKEMFSSMEYRLGDDK